MSRTKNNVKNHFNILKKSHIKRLVQVEKLSREIEVYKEAIHNDVKSLSGKIEEVTDVCDDET